jgi:hypothetical protein
MFRCIGKESKIGHAEEITKERYASTTYFHTCIFLPYHHYAPCMRTAIYRPRVVCVVSGGFRCFFTFNPAWQFRGVALLREHAVGRFEAQLG